MEQWTAEWRDSKTDQLLSCESLINLKQRPSITLEPLDVAGNVIWNGAGKANWSDIEISYQTEDLGQVLLLKWLSYMYEISWQEYNIADVSLRRYEKDKIIEDWYLEKCVITSYNYSGFGVMQLGVIFKFGKAHLISA